MNNNQKLELTWYGKEEPINVEPRLLIENTELSYNVDTENGITDNILIHGDNLLALKALESKFSGQVKCIYIDPPYNTGAAFEHYDDNLEHSIWLKLMKARLEILKKLLADDGLIFVQIDDNEQAYLKVMMDEIFGRNNFVNCICVKMSEASGTKMAHVEKKLPKLKEFILVYKKCSIKLNEIKIPKEKWDKEYKSVILGITEDELKYIKTIASKDDRSEDEVLECRKILDKATYTSLSNLYQENNIVNPQEKINFNYKNAYRIFQTVSMGSGTTQSINDSRKEYCKNVFFPHITSKKKMYIIRGDYDINMRKPRIQVLFADEYLEYNPCDLWTDIKTTGLDNEGNINFKNSKKPEKLIERILTLGSREGDLVLDSFLGSGTTAAVAHKMRRRWIGVEMGNHAYSHCKVRLDKVIAGEDMGGITKSVNWQGGGGYRFYELAPSLINKDEFGEPVINTEYSADMLASAVALHEDFKFQPDNNLFWKQSVGNENSYLFVTTRHLNIAYLESIKSTMEENEYLIIACRSFDKNLEKQYSNITVKKIPQMLLTKCEFGKHDYKLNIINPPVYEDEEEICNE
ncbi:site-specific DNA-methyltransferase [Paludicola sp. MB14-C6]|uniref:site-specific DNA-methyltransferase n=1 Tax=Paludihabitans sp. MB14-C6 TaxID=3070656 RepID=UPI0027DBBCFF|nr:site-specific DNA-methyltransferase [Paludicola sp. MB14-C6]WMJ23442.1 site-specific DNA-methyltransferase [Paludicola sp. MB14-C6]